jgi:hypothetical protein
MSKKVLETVRHWWGKRIAAGPAICNPPARQAGSEIDSHDCAASAARWPDPAHTLLGSVEHPDPSDHVVAGSQKRECCTPGIGKR